MGACAGRTRGGGVFLVLRRGVGHLGHHEASRSACVGAPSGPFVPCGLDGCSPAAPSREAPGAGPSFSAPDGRSRSIHRDLGEHARPPPSPPLFEAPGSRKTLRTRSLVFGSAACDRLTPAATCVRRGTPRRSGWFRSTRIAKRSFAESALGPARSAARAPALTRERAGRSRRAEHARSMARDPLSPTNAASCTWRSRGAWVDGVETSVSFDTASPCTHERLAPAGDTSIRNSPEDPDPRPRAARSVPECLAIPPHLETEKCHPRPTREWATRRRARSA